MHLGGELLKEEVTKKLVFRYDPNDVGSGPRLRERVQEIQMKMTWWKEFPAGHLKEVVTALNKHLSPIIDGAEFYLVEVKTTR